MVPMADSKILAPGGRSPAANVKMKVLWILGGRTPQLESTKKSPESPTTAQRLKMEVIGKSGGGAPGWNPRRSLSEIQRKPTENLLNLRPTKSYQKSIRMLTYIKSARPLWPESSGWVTFSIFLRKRGLPLSISLPGDAPPPPT